VLGIEGWQRTARAKPRTRLGSLPIRCWGGNHEQVDSLL